MTKVAFGDLFVYGMAALAHIYHYEKGQYSIRKYSLKNIASSVK